MSFWKKFTNAATGKGKLGWLNPPAKLSRSIYNRTLKSSFHKLKRGFSSNPHSATSYSGVADYGPTGSIIGKV